MYLSQMSLSCLFTSSNPFRFHRTEADSSWKNMMFYFWYFTVPLRLVASSTFCLSAKLWNLIRTGRGRWFGPGFGTSVRWALSTFIWPAFVSNPSSSGIQLSKNLVGWPHSTSSGKPKTPPLVWSCVQPQKSCSRPQWHVLQTLAVRVSVWDSGPSFSSITFIMLAVISWIVWQKAGSRVSSPPAVSGCCSSAIGEWLGKLAAASGLFILIDFLPSFSGILSERLRKYASILILGCPTHKLLPQWSLVELYCEYQCLGKELRKVNLSPRHHLVSSHVHTF